MNANELLPAAGRHNMYDAIHRGLRLGHARMLERLGATDFADDEERAALLADLRAFLQLAQGHLDSEESVIHPAVEAAEPGASESAHAGHEGHETAFADLARLAEAAEDATPDLRVRAGRALYHRYALFVAADLEHMHEEETGLLGRMHRLFSDARLGEIEGAIVAKIAPAAMTGYLRLIIPAISAPERVSMLGAMRDAMPPPVFHGLMADAVRPALNAAAFARLMTALDARCAA